MCIYVFFYVCFFAKPFTYILICSYKDIKLHVEREKGIKLVIFSEKADGSFV